MMGLQTQVVVVPFLGQPKQLVTKFERPVNFAPPSMKEPQPRNDFETLVAVPESSAQFVGAMIGLGRLRGRHPRVVVKAGPSMV